MMSDDTMKELKIALSGPYAEWLRSLPLDAVVIDYDDFMVIFDERKHFIYENTELDEIRLWLSEHSWTSVLLDVSGPLTIGFTPPSDKDVVLFKLTFSKMFEEWASRREYR